MDFLQWLLEARLPVGSGSLLLRDVAGTVVGLRSPGDHADALECVTYGALTLIGSSVRPHAQKDAEHGTEALLPGSALR